MKHENGSDAADRCLEVLALRLAGVTDAYSNLTKPEFRNLRYFDVLAKRDALVVPSLRREIARRAKDDCEQSLYVRRQNTGEVNLPAGNGDGVGGGADTDSPAGDGVGKNGGGRGGCRGGGRGGLGGADKPPAPE